MKKNPVKVLVVEDDDDDYVLFRDLVHEIKFLEIELDRVDNYRRTLEAAKNDPYDVYIIDYVLSGSTGIEILHALKEIGIRKPVIILTGHGDHDIDMQAMKEGAADYLEKERMTPQLLERVIRYCLQEFQSHELLRESENRLRQLSLKLISTQEEERKRIAKELHDSIGSNLAAVKFEIQKNEMSSSKRRTAAGVYAQSKNLMDIVQHTIEETRRICHDLRPSILDDLGIIMAINWYCRTFGETYSKICVNMELRISEEEIPDYLKVVIFRVMQEAFTNAAKHSRGDKVSLLFEKSDGNLILTITDNGRGFDVNDKSRDDGTSCGMGLVGMDERVRSSGGVFSIFSDNKTGTKIYAAWPVKAGE